MSALRNQVRRAKAKARKVLLALTPEERALIIERLLREQNKS
jgi:hypothetical protein